MWFLGVIPIPVHRQGYSWIPAHATARTIAWLEWLEGGGDLEPVLRLKTQFALFARMSLQTYSYLQTKHVIVEDYKGRQNLLRQDTHYSDPSNPIIARRHHHAIPGFKMTEDCLLWILLPELVPPLAVITYIKCPLWGWDEGSRIHSVILKYPAICCPLPLLP